MWRIIFRNDSFYIPCMERLNKKKKKKKEVYRNKPSTRTIFTIISFRYFLNNDIHKNDKSFEQSNIFLFNNIINIYAILMHNKTIYITESHYKNSYCRE